MKRMRLVMVFLSLMVMVTGIGAKPQSGKTLKLLESRNDGTGAVLFLFRASGNFNRAELTGWIRVQGVDANFPMNCRQVDEDTVQCTATRSAAGHYVILHVGNLVFWTRVPDSGGIPATPTPSPTPDNQRSNQDA